MSTGMQRLAVEDLDLSTHENRRFFSEVIGIPKIKPKTRKEKISEFIISLEREARDYQKLISLGCVVSEKVRQAVWWITNNATSLHSVDVMAKICTLDAERNPGSFENQYMAYYRILKAEGRI